MVSEVGFKFSSDNQSGMDKSNSPQKLNFSRNISEHWKLWKQELTLYMTATEKPKKSDKVKSSILMTCIGPWGREEYNTFVFDDDSMKMNFSWILQQFDNYCSPQKNVTLLRYKPFSYRQSEDKVLIILLPTWRSQGMWIFGFTELTYQGYDRNWYHRQSFATPTPWTWFDIRLCSKTWTCVRGN